jgi:ribosomal protein L11 methyltransferase
VTPRFQTFEVLVAAEHEDAASAALWECGTVGVQVETRPGSLTALLASFRDEAGLAQRLAEALCAVPGAKWGPIDLPDVDWVARFRQEFRAFEAAGFAVVPEWDESARPGARTLVIDPGRAFGTGTHETTRLCLELLAEEARRRSLGRVLDVGAGTGILAMAALRLGAPLAAAVDLDPEATASCARHAQLNRVPLAVVQGDGGRPFLPARFDVLLANLMAPLLIERSGELRSLCAAGATLILSGLLAEDVPAVADAYAAGTVEARVEGEWASLRIRLA